MKWTLALLLTLVFGGATAQQPPDRLKRKPFILGEIVQLPSVQLGETRTLNIYLPAGYSASDSIRYPVVYLLDGSADEDFIHVVGLYQFNTFPWINRVPPSIIVGIANTDRKHDFTFPSSIDWEKKSFPTTGGSAAFVRFLQMELIPFIDREYQSSSSRTLIGQSLGGLLATEILLKKPSLFDKYIIISPSLWWNNGSLLQVEPAGMSQPVSVYVGVGKEGLTPGDSPHVMEVDANLLADKLRALERKNLQVYFDYLPNEDHASISHQAVSNALRLLYPAPR